MVQARSTIKGSKTGARRWMLRADIVKKYGCEVTADELIHAKESDPALRRTQVRDHPELPKRADLRLYLCWDESFKTDTEDVLISKMLEVSRKDSHGRGRSKDRKKKDKRKRRRRSTSSSKSSPSSSSSQSSKSSQDSDSLSSKSRKAGTKVTKKSKKSKKGKRRASPSESPHLQERQGYRRRRFKRPRRIGRRQKSKQRRNDKRKRNKQKRSVKKTRRMRRRKPRRSKSSRSKRTSKRYEQVAKRPGTWG